MKFNPEKLNVEYRKGVRATKPVIPRRYTLTHFDNSAEIFLTIGPEFAYDRITELRDDVMGEWGEGLGKYFFYVYLMLDKEKREVPFRNYIFRRELPLALTAIRYGDNTFFQAHPELDYVPIMVFFQSKNPKYNKVENWGSFSRYDFTDGKDMKMPSNYMNPTKNT